MLPITSNGNLLKPLVILNNTIDIKIKGSKNVSVTYNELGALDMQELIKIIKANLTFQEKILIITPTYDFLDQSKNIPLNDVELLLLPKGLSCIANPLKEVLPIFMEVISKTERNTKLEDVFAKWIEDAIHILSIHHSYVLKSAFNCLKISL